MSMKMTSSFTARMAKHQKTCALNYSVIVPVHQMNRTDAGIVQP